MEFNYLEIEHKIMEKEEDDSKDEKEKELNKAKFC